MFSDKSFHVFQSLQSSLNYQRQFKQFSQKKRFNREETPFVIVETVVCLHEPSSVRVDYSKHKTLYKLTGLGNITCFVFVCIALRVSSI